MWFKVNNNDLNKMISTSILKILNIDSQKVKRGIVHSFYQNKDFLILCVEIVYEKEYKGVEFYNIKIKEGEIL